jgi:hypothetical protein
MLMLLAAGLELQSQLTAQFSRAQTGHILAFCVSHRTVYYFWSRSGSGVLCVFAGNSVSKLSLATTPSSPTFSSHLSVYQTCLAFSNNTPKTENETRPHPFFVAGPSPFVAATFWGRLPKLFPTGVSPRNLLVASASSSSSMLTFELEGCGFLSKVCR